MDLDTRIEDLLHQNLVRERRYGSHRAWIQVAEVRNEEWGKDLPIPHVQEHMEAVLRRPEWYRLDVKSTAKDGIIGYEYTDTEGASLTKEYSGY